MVRMFSICSCIFYLTIIVLLPRELRAAEADADSAICISEDPVSAPCNIPNPDLLNIYVTFPDQPQFSDLPAFHSSVKTRMEQYFDEMSSGNHIVNITTMIRPAPFHEDRYIADNNYSYYNDGTWAKWYELIDEILLKVYNDDNTAFEGIDFVAIYYAPNMLDAIGVSGAYVSAFGSNTSIYDGPGTSSHGSSQWVVEWHNAHEYGHCLGFSHDRVNGAYSVMSGRGYTGNAPPYNPRARESIGWIESTQLVTVTSDSLHFGEVVGTEEDTLIFTVINNGVATLVVAKIIDPDSSLGVNPSAFILAPNESLDVDVWLNVSVIDSFKTNLEIYSNDPVTQVYQLVVDAKITISVEDRNKQIPVKYELSQNYPNPFNAMTLIYYSIPKYGNVTLTVYNLLGEEVARLVDSVQSPGFKQETWNASNFASGIYFYRLQAGSPAAGFVQTKKMILLK